MKATERKELLDAIQARFEKHATRHPGVVWKDILKRLDGNTAALATLAAMEASGGEPDVINRDKTSGRVTFCDCAPESPIGRRSLCFDKAAREARKEAAPVSSAMERAKEIGVSLLTEADYRSLQELGEFDVKTSSWVSTPDDVRALGGALFCDRRYGKVFVYHNGAESYYAARGFRGLLRL